MAKEAHFSIRNLLAGLAFATQGSFSDPNLYADCTVELLNLDPSEGIASQEAVHFLREQHRVLRQKVQERTRSIGQDQALEIVALRDLERILQVASALPTTLLDVGSVSAAANTLPSRAASLGFSTEQAELRVVDVFPSPHEDAKFAAMTYDTVDQKTYGMKPGVALLANALQPLYSINLFAHELVHVSIGKVETSRLARGLEEGIADLIGLMLSSELIGRNVAEQALINSRSRHGRHQLGRLYRDSLLHACGVVLLLGEQGLVELVRNASRHGRNELKELEARSVSGQLARTTGSIPSVLDRTQLFAHRFLTTSPDHVVSPLAVVVGEAMQGGERTDELIARLELDPAEGHAAIKELEDRVYMAVQMDDYVAFSETSFYASLGQLRYDVAHSLDS